MIFAEHQIFLRFWYDDLDILRLLFGGEGQFSKFVCSLISVNQCKLPFHNPEAPVILLH